MLKITKNALAPCGVNTAGFLKYVWPFFNNMHERVDWTVLEPSIYSCKK